MKNKRCQQVEFWVLLDVCGDHGGKVNWGKWRTLEKSWTNKRERKWGQMGNGYNYWSKFLPELSWLVESGVFWGIICGIIITNWGNKVWNVFVLVPRLYGKSYLISHRSVYFHVFIINIFGWRDDNWPTNLESPKWYCMYYYVITWSLFTL